MDEVWTSFDSLPNSTGNKTISIMTTGNKKVSICACMLACTANGQKLKSLIFKRKTVPKGDFWKDVLIQTNERGWMNKSIMLKWLKISFQKWKGAFSEPLDILIVDYMDSHLLDSVKAECCNNARSDTRRANWKNLAAMGLDCK